MGERHYAALGRSLTVADRPESGVELEIGKRHPWFLYKVRIVWPRCCTHTAVAVVRFGPNSIYGSSEWNLSGCVGSVTDSVEKLPHSSQGDVAFSPR